MSSVFRLPDFEGAIGGKAFRKGIAFSKEYKCVGSRIYMKWPMNLYEMAHEYIRNFDRYLLTKWQVFGGLHLHLMCWVISLNVMLHDIKCKAPQQTFLQNANSGGEKVENKTGCPPPWIRQPE